MRFSFFPNRIIKMGAQLNILLRTAAKRGKSGYWNNAHLPALVRSKKHPAGPRREKGLSLGESPPPKARRPFLRRKQAMRASTAMIVRVDFWWPTGQGVRGSCGQECSDEIGLVKTRKSRKGESSDRPTDGRSQSGFFLTPELNKRVQCGSQGEVCSIRSLPLSSRSSEFPYTQLF
jgi:hypothetical protein